MYARYATCNNFLRFLTSGDLDLWPFQLKISMPLRAYLCPGERLYQFWFLKFFFVFELRARTGQTDGQTNGLTDGRARRAMRPIWRPHNNSESPVDQLISEWKICGIVARTQWKCSQIKTSDNAQCNVESTVAQLRSYHKTKHSPKTTILASH